MITRRSFLRLAGAGTLAWYTFQHGKFLLCARAQIPGGTLDPLVVPKYQRPLLIPPVMPKAGTITTPGGKQADYYEISVQQFSQQILPPGLLPTTVWGYGAVTSASKTGLLLHHAPSLTIEAQADRPVRVKWINGLVNAQGNYLPHLLAVDPTLHWANPGGGPAGRDTRPTFEATPGPYTGPVPMVTHLHGAVGVGPESDGYPEAWYLPAAANLPAGYATEGTWYDYFRDQALLAHQVAWGPGFAIFEYPNANRASTLWYHDHALGMTRLNVYAGPAGFYLIRGGPTGDDAVLDTRDNTRAVLPGPAPRAGDAFPSDKMYYEIPIAIQDRAFDIEGMLFYPSTREFFDGATAENPGYIPTTDLSPIWNPEFFGNMIMVNGNTWPFLAVAPRRYRFRFLNGCQSRFLILDFSNIPGVEVWQIGNEGGFLPAPVNLTARGNKLPMGLAERADVIVDFANVPVGQYVLGNVGPDEPYGGGVPSVDFARADPGSTGQIMQFRLIPWPRVDDTTPPQFLRLPAVTPLPAEKSTRRLALLEMMSMHYDGPAAAMLGEVGADGMPTHHMWSEPVTEDPNVGDTELWEFYNFTADAHPMHVHEVAFEVVNRQSLVIDAATGEVATPVQLVGDPRPPEPWERGFKDTVTVYPGQVTRVRARFLVPGQFVWHCHIVEHEDNEMMRPYRIGAADPGAPA